jgi:hypothetical protein
MHAIRRLLLALLLGAGAAHAENWFDLDALRASTGPGIEVDTDALREAGGRRLVTVRVSYPQARMHTSGAAYRSVVATVEFGCDGAAPRYRDAAFYSEAGGRGVVTLRENGLLPVSPDPAHELLPGRSVELLARAACTRPTPAVP